MPQATKQKTASSLSLLIFGVAPDGVYTDPLCLNTGGELLPRLFILTIQSYFARLGLEYILKYGGYFLLHFP